MHHAAGHRSGFVDDDRVTGQRQVPRGREAARPGADDEHTLSRWRRVGCDGPPLRERFVAEEALDRMDAHRVVDILAVARAFSEGSDCRWTDLDCARHRAHGYSLFATGGREVGCYAPRPLELLAAPAIPPSKGVLRPMSQTLAAPRDVALRDDFYSWLQKSCDWD